LVGPCHTTLYKEGGAAGSRHEVRRQPHSPPTFPSLIYRERSSDGKLHRRRHCLDRRCPSADLHSASLPSRKSPTWLADPAAPLPEMIHPLLPFLCTHMHHICTYTIIVCTRLNPHLVDPYNLSPTSPQHYHDASGRNQGTLAPPP
jgi:hypothetical protein